MSASSVTVGDGSVSLATRSEGSGPDFVWAHALLCSMRAEDRSGLFDWSGVGARVTRYDARSHGHSPADASPRNHRWEVLGRDMLDVAAARGADPAIFGGASMGAATSIWAACLEPRRVSGLVLAIPPTAWNTRGAQAALYRRAGAVMGTGLMTPLTMGLRLPRPRVRRGTRAALFDAVLDEVGRAPNKQLAPILRGAAASDLPDAERLSELDAPTLILAWRGDRSHPESVARALASTIPGAELVLEDDPRAWSDHVAAFIEAQDLDRDQNVPGNGN